MLRRRDLACGSGKMTMTYRLYFGELEIGRVTEIDGDDLTARGQLTASLAQHVGAHPQAGRLAELIEQTEALIELAEASTGDDGSPSAAFDERSRHLLEFDDLCDSPLWHVVDTDGRRLPISCPLFRRGGEIIWRWGEA